MDEGESWPGARRIRRLLKRTPCRAAPPFSREQGNCAVADGAQPASRLPARAGLGIVFERAHFRQRPSARAAFHAVLRRARR